MLKLEVHSVSKQLASADSPIVPDRRKKKGGGVNVGNAQIV